MQYILSSFCFLLTIHFIIALVVVKNTVHRHKWIQVRRYWSQVESSNHVEDFAISSSRVEKKTSKDQNDAKDSIEDDEVTNTNNKLDEIFARLNTNQNIGSDEVPQEIRDQVENLAPSDWEMRKNMLGLTSWTVNGFILAGLLLLANSIFGLGWAGDLLEKVTSNSNSESTAIGSSEKYYIDLDDPNSLEQFRIENK